MFDCLGFRRKKILLQLDQVCRDTQELPLMDRAAAMHPAIDTYLDCPDEGSRLRCGSKLMALAGADPRPGRTRRQRAPSPTPTASATARSWQP